MLASAKNSSAPQRSTRAFVVLTYWKRIRWIQSHRAIGSWASCQCSKSLASKKWDKPGTADTSCAYVCANGLLPNKAEPRTIAAARTA